MGWCIGASGWNYRHWRGLFYPEKLPQRLWLPFYAQHFGTVELNNTFYRMPRPEVVAVWRELAPPHFVFAAKLWKGITHYKKLLNCQRFLLDYFRAMGQLLPAQRGPVLIQLPPFLPRNEARLASFLADLREAAPADMKIAVEFRHADWLTPEIYRTLNVHGAAICLHDMQGHAPVSRPNDVPLIYLRRHGGRNERYAGRYDPEDIHRDAADIRQWVAEGREVFVYYNNDIGGHAVENARELVSALHGLQCLE